MDMHGDMHEVRCVFIAFCRQVVQCPGFEGWVTFVGEGSPGTLVVRCPGFEGWVRLLGQGTLWHSRAAKGTEALEDGLGSCWQEAHRLGVAASA